ncbi:hypothetical protein C7S18_05725 [Ahniella affigens]|uniref:Uncharacterized protein n=1 Tax=Ahniella affigens TaxID=2021234 RepID=A0A2P1PPG1_9GAMM|nr:hypothetical protein C7S18_05725 [Ahniella affigens]
MTPRCAGHVLQLAILNAVTVLLLATATRIDAHQWPFLANVLTRMADAIERSQESAALYLRSHGYNC